MKPVYAIATVLGGLFLVVPASAIFWARYPRPWAPCPLVLVLPAFNEMYLMSILIPTIGFWIVGWKLFVGNERVGWWATTAFAIGAIANTVHLAWGWSHGLQWQGLFHTAVVVGANVAFCALLTILLVRVRLRPSYRGAFLFYWLSFLWFGWYSFPYFGELP